MESEVTMIGPRGIVFDIREFTIHDGPGIRTTVFLKGCPLRCAWCHNPEGQSRVPEIMRSPLGARLVGREYTSSDLAAIIRRQSTILSMNGGGVTFSGGEPLAQATFLIDVIGRLKGVHVLLDTSGFASEDDFKSVVSRCSMVYFDLKIIDPREHRRYTGLDNVQILRNLLLLSSLQIPYVIRVPLVPGVTDTHGNLESIAGSVKNLPGLVRVDLLPYNRAAGGKYSPLGKQFTTLFDENLPVNATRVPFEQAGIPVQIAGNRGKSPLS